MRDWQLLWDNKANRCLFVSGTTSGNGAGRAEARGARRGRVASVTPVTAATRVTASVTESVSGKRALIKCRTPIPPNPLTTHRSSLHRLEWVSSCLYLIINITASGGPSVESRGNSSVNISAGYRWTKCRTHLPIRKWSVKQMQTYIQCTQFNCLSTAKI